MATEEAINGACSAWVLVTHCAEIFGKGRWHYVGFKSWLIINVGPYDRSFAMVCLDGAKEHVIRTDVAAMVAQ